MSMSHLCLFLFLCIVCRLVSRLAQTSTTTYYPDGYRTTYHCQIQYGLCCVIHIRLLICIFWRMFSFITLYFFEFFVHIGSLFVGITPTNILPISIVNTFLSFESHSDTNRTSLTMLCISDHETDRTAVLIFYPRSLSRSVGCHTPICIGLPEHHKHSLGIFYPILAQIHMSDMSFLPLLTILQVAFHLFVRNLHTDENRG